MTERDRQYFDALLETIGTPGWKVLVRDAVAAIEDKKNALVDSKNAAVSNQLRGAIWQLAELVNLEDAIKTQLAQYGEEENADL